MNDEQLLDAVRQVDPFPGGAPAGHAAEIFARVLRTAQLEQELPIRPRQARRRLAIGAIVLALVAGSAGIAVGASGWLTGEPAPREVVADFQSYTPQLGFHPDPGSAVAVARDGDITLYAATNREGTYCVVVSTPWKRPDTLDGGTCVPAAIASGQISAGVLGISISSRQGYATLVVGGRVDGGAGGTMRFTGPSGNSIERPVSSSGFFVGQIRISLPPCAAGDWSPTFTARDPNGNEIAQSTITLIQAPQGGHVCVFSFLRSR